MLSEDEFLQAVATWGKKKRRHSKTRGKSNVRYQYRRLKAVYGFFTGLL